MPKINQEEYEILKSLDDKWKWIARNGDRRLEKYSEKPYKYYAGAVWRNEYNRMGETHEYFPTHLFQFIQWTDEEPYEIAELIEEYESDEAYKIINRQFESLYEESEETEVKKDIEWLKEEINKILRDKVSDGINYYDYMDLKNSFNELINQLDEPEVLMQELPVIPKFVAEWYESEGKRNSWWNWFYKWGRDEGRTELESKTIRWMQYFNEEKFVDMFLHGYEVEEEQKYQVIIRDGEYMRLYLCKHDGHDGNVTIGTNDNYFEKCPEVTYLTEQEIKDYDERYWPFAVNVEELEQ